MRTDSVTLFWRYIGKSFKVMFETDLPIGTSATGSCNM